MCLDLITKFDMHYLYLITKVNIFNIENHKFVDSLDKCCLCTSKWTKSQTETGTDPSRGIPSNISQ